MPGLQSQATAVDSRSTGHLPARVQIPAPASHITGFEHCQVLPELQLIAYQKERVKYPGVFIPNTMLRTLSTSLACIFEYPDVIDKKELADYLRENGYLIPQMEREEVITSSDFIVGETFTQLPTVAYKVKI